MKGHCIAGNDAQYPIYLISVQLNDNATSFEWFQLICPTFFRLETSKNSTHGQSTAAIGKAGRVVSGSWLLCGCSTVLADNATVAMAVNRMVPFRTWSGHQPPPILHVSAHFSISDRNGIILSRFRIGAIPIPHSFSNRACWWVSRNALFGNFQTCSGQW